MRASAFRRSHQFLCHETSNRHARQVLVAGSLETSRLSTSIWAKSFSSLKPVDLRSDTVTMPTPTMLAAVVHAPLGDDVMGEDPTVKELEQYMADLFGKEKGLFVPTGTMANLVAILSHCDTRAAEIMIGASSHLNLWEGKLSLDLFIIWRRYSLKAEEFDYFYLIQVEELPIWVAFIPCRLQKTRTPE
jgi:hypothetical protein